MLISYVSTDFEAVTQQGCDATSRPRPVENMTGSYRWAVTLA